MRAALIAVALAALAVAAAVPARAATPARASIYYTTYWEPGETAAARPSHNVRRLDVTYDPATRVLSVPGGRGPGADVADTPTADGLFFDSDGLLLVGGKTQAGAGVLHAVRPAGPAAQRPLAYRAPGAAVFHVTLSPDLRWIWGTGIPSRTAAAFPGAAGPGGRRDGVAHRVVSARDDTPEELTSIAWDRGDAACGVPEDDPSAYRAWYTASDPDAQPGEFGEAHLPADPSTAGVLQLTKLFVMPAHGMTFDPLTRTIIIAGASQITQIDPYGPGCRPVVVARRTVATPQGFRHFDQLAVDGNGRLFAADNGGWLYFLDYSRTGRVDVAAGGSGTERAEAFVFVEDRLDDIAPLAAPGSPVPDLAVRITTATVNGTAVARPPKTVPRNAVVGFRVVVINPSGVAIPASAVRAAGAGAGLAPGPGAAGDEWLDPGESWVMVPAGGGMVTRAVTGCAALAVTATVAPIPAGSGLTTSDGRTLDGETVLGNNSATATQAVYCPAARATTPRAPRATTTRTPRATRTTRTARTTRTTRRTTRAERPVITVTGRLPGRVRGGDVHRYRVRVYARGSATAAGTHLSVAIPFGTSLVVRPRGTRMRRGRLVWSAGRVRPGRPAEIVLTLRADGAVRGRRCGRATATAAAARPVAATSCVVIVPAPRPDRPPVAG